MPRADLVLFVTSADRPFTESERAFLEIIHRWRKRIVCVVNKIDLLQRREESDEVIAFVRSGATGVLGAEPRLFALSARDALRAMTTGDADALEASGWPALETWLSDQLTEDQRFLLKLASPLGVAARVGDDLAASASARRGVIESDQTAVDSLESEISAFESAMQAEFDHRMARIEVHLARMRERGEAFLDDRFRLTRLRGLMDRDALERDFEEVVVGDSPTAIEQEVSRLIDHIVDLEHGVWRQVDSILVNRGRALPGRDEGFAARRRALLSTVGRESGTVVSAFDPAEQGARLSEQVTGGAHPHRSGGGGSVGPRLSAAGSARDGSGGCHRPVRRRHARRPEPDHCAASKAQGRGGAAQQHGRTTVRSGAVAQRGLRR